MLFDSSVRREIARTFGATLVVILTIVLTMMLIRTLGEAARGSVAPKDVVLALGFLAVGQLPTMLTLSLFVAIVVTLGRMYRDSEMAIWFSSGIPLSRFARPVLRAGWPVIAVTLLLVSVIWPWANAQIAEMKTRYQQRSDLLRVSPGSFQSSADGNRVFFVERAGDVEGAKHVFLLDKQEEREAVTTARSGRLISDNGERRLILETGQRNEQNTASQTFSRMTFEHFAMTVDLDSTASLDKPPPKATATLDLLLQPSAANQGELTWRLGLVLAAANLLLLGIATAATNPRRASNWNLMFALLGFVVYYNLVNLSQAWVASQRLSMGAALAAVHVPALLLAVLLILWRDRGAVQSWREWLRPGGAP